MAFQVEVFLIALCVATPIYLLLRMPWRKHDPREWALGMFWIFLIALGVMVFRGATLPSDGDVLKAAAERLRTGYMINVIPLKTIRGYFTIKGSENYYINIVGNVVMFVPFGFGLPFLWKKMNKFFPLNLTLLFVPVFVETVQLFIGRSVDIDDVILNFAGGIIGALFYTFAKIAVPEIKSIAR